MTDSQKLEALIKKAIDGEWKAEDWVQGPQHLTQHLLQMSNVYSVTFNHSFNKALFGEESRPFTICWYKLEGKHMKDPDEFVAQHRYIPAWQYHLQQLVLLPTISEQVDYLYREAIENKADKV